MVSDSKSSMPVNNPFYDNRRPLKKILTEYGQSLQKLEESILSRPMPIKKKIKAADIAFQLNGMSQKWFSSLSNSEKHSVEEYAFHSDHLLINQSLYGSEKAICFSHNFSPYSDPAAFVCTKRLRQISEVLERPLNWTVISQDLSKDTGKDSLFETMFGRFQYTERTTFSGSPCKTLPRSFDWGNSAYDLVREESFSVCYSHCFQPGSHIAAKLYKQDHPDTLWIAEFGDPLFMGSNNQPREEWSIIEQMVYSSADMVVFTNENQREFMLGSFRNSKLADECRSKSIILNNPTIDNRYCHIVDSSISPNEDCINIIYAGSFYAKRPVEPLFELLSNPRVSLYLFVAMPWTIIPNIGSLAPDDRSRIHICDPVGHLEILNLCSKMDYCALVDFQFDGPINPYEPSKLYDYFSSNTPVVAFTQEGSAVSKHEDILASSTISGMREIATLLRKKAPRNN